jgi:hypothetical protein
MPKKPEDFCTTLDNLLPMPKRPRDINQLAKMIVDLSTGEIEEKPESVKAKSGRLGGLKGGKARAESLTPERRKEIAKNAAEKRWNSLSNS